MTNNRSHRNRFIAVLALGAMVSACDVTSPIEDVSLRLNVSGEPIELDDASGRISISGGQTTASASTVGNQLDIRSVEALYRIGIDPHFFGFVPSPGLSSDLNNGTVELFLFMGGVPVPGSPVVVTITNDAVTSVSPNSIVIDEVTVDRDLIEGVLNGLPPAQRPALDNWEEMTIDEVIAGINAALEDSSFPLAIVAVTTGDISGELKLNSFEIDAEVVL